MRAGVRGAFVEAQRRHEAVDVRSELHADFDRLSVGDRRIRRRRRRRPDAARTAARLRDHAIGAHRGEDHAERCSDRNRRRTCWARWIMTRSTSSVSVLRGKVRQSHRPRRLSRKHQVTHADANREVLQNRFANDVLANQHVRSQRTEVVRAFRPATSTRKIRRSRVLSANSPPVLDAKCDAHSPGVCAPAGARSRPPAEQIFWSRRRRHVRHRSQLRLACDYSRGALVPKKEKAVDEQPSAEEAPIRPPRVLAVV